MKWVGCVCAVKGSEKRGETLGVSTTAVPRDSPGGGQRRYCLLLGEWVGGEDGAGCSDAYGIHPHFEGLRDGYNCK